MDYARKRAVAEGLEGSWTVEIGPSGPLLAMRHPSLRHAGTVRRVTDQVVDPRRGTVEVHSEPCGTHYGKKEPYIFGDQVAFGPWTVDTSGFRRYARG
ncbi:hypothetical protein [Streptomyces longispororuber]|uniref:hypothetical protein n=1 Tax=Streptomyces longispororuber TaxID=68230 RepID=UPI00167D348B|nr:hypothetical protein [Streptomyces longispororuber]